MTDKLSELLTEFDEMGYAPTTLTTETEKAAREWKKRLVAAIESELPSNSRQLKELPSKTRQLEEENSVLCKRLNNAMEIPFKIGEMSYIINSREDGCFYLAERKIVGIRQIEQEPKPWDNRTIVYCAIVEEITESGDSHQWYYDIYYFDKEWWTDKAVAEKHLPR